MKRMLVLMLGAGMFLSLTVNAAGNVDAGRVKGETCLGCHGVPSHNNVYPTYHVPKLGGQHAAYLIAAMKAYKDGQRSHETMLANIVNLSQQDMEDIAAYFEQDGK